jgi:hypothetical protein
VLPVEGGEEAIEQAEGEDEDCGYDGLVVEVFHGWSMRQVEWDVTRKVSCKTFI